MSNRLKILREKATRPRRTVPVLLDGEVRAQIEAVEDELDRLESEPEPTDRRMSTKPKARRAELEQVLAELFAAAEESTLYLVVEGMQRSAYRALVAAHPPRQEDGKMLPADFRAGGVNAETFGPALARACIIGYRERPEADAPVLSFDPNAADEVNLDYLLGCTDGDAQVDGFLTPHQLDTIVTAALAVCTGDDAVPLPRKRSETPPSDAA